MKQQLVYQPPLSLKQKYLCMKQTRLPAIYSLEIHYHDTMPSLNVHSSAHQIGLHTKLEKQVPSANELLQ